MITALKAGDQGAAAGERQFRHSPNQPQRERDDRRELPRWFFAESSRKLPGE